MCIIIDQNKRSGFVKQSDAESIHLLDAVCKKRTKIVFGGRLCTNEYQEARDCYRFILRLWQSGKAELVPSADVDSEEARINSEGGYKSNDPHVLALAIVTGARLLFTSDDDLIGDFKNCHLISPRGKIYGGSKLGSTSYRRVLADSCRYRNCRQCRKR